MKDTTLQLTIRGLDLDTKAALVAKAKKQGVSLNRLALDSLQKSVELSSVVEQLEAIQDYLALDPISKEVMQAFDEAIAWSDMADRQKQEKDARDAGL